MFRGVVVSLVGFFVFVLGAIVRGQRRKVVTGIQGMIGRLGEARTRLDPEGTVFADGTVVNKAGTLALALLARQHRVPFFVISESLKVSASRWKGGGETPPPADSPDEPPAVYFDVTPPRLITALITEEGVFGPRELGPLARRARRWQRALGLAPASSA